MNSRPTLHLLHGLPGCGKTTFARELERTGGGVLFSQDEWMSRLFGQNPPADRFGECLQRIQSLIWDQAGRVLDSGTSVILDSGFWTRDSRDAARKFAAEHNAEAKLYAFDIDLAEMKRRVLTRTAALPADCVVIDEYAFDLFASKLEPLGSDEPHAIIQGGAVPAAAAASPLPNSDVTAC